MRLGVVGKNVLGRGNSAGRKELGIFEQLKGGQCGGNQCVWDDDEGGGGDWAPDMGREAGREAL